MKKTRNNHHDLWIDEALAQEYWTTAQAKYYMCGANPTCTSYDQLSDKQKSIFSRMRTLIEENWFSGKIKLEEMTSTLPHQNKKFRGKKEDFIRIAHDNGLSIFQPFIKHLEATTKVNELKKDKQVRRSKKCPYLLQIVTTRIRLGENFNAFKNEMIENYLFETKPKKIEETYNVSDDIGWIYVTKHENQKYRIHYSTRIEKNTLKVHTKALDSLKSYFLYLANHSPSI